MKCQIPVTWLFVAASVLLLAGGTADEPKKVPLTIFMSEVGERLSIHFTMEQDWRGPGPSALKTCQVPQPSELKSTDDVVAFLKKHASDAALIETDAGNPRVIHVIEHSVAGIPGYLMDQRTSVAVAGTPADLLAELDKRSNHLLHVPRGGPTGMIFGDGTTRIKVDARNHTYRQILTEGIPLESYNSVIWISWVQKVGETMETSVAFQQQVPAKAKPSTQPAAAARE